MHYRFIGQEKKPMPVLFFDAHFQIVDLRFSISKNPALTPDSFTVADYRQALMDLGPLLTPAGGAVVSGSVHGFDQAGLLDALETLNAAETEAGTEQQNRADRERSRPGRIPYVGVTQIPYDYPDSAILSLNRQGVRAVRFQLHGDRSSEYAGYVDQLAHRVYELAGWHSEFSIDPSRLDDTMIKWLLALPQIVIDHPELSVPGLPALLRLVEGGARVKVCGFQRGDFNWLAAMKQIYAVNPDALMLATHLPGTRSHIPLQRSDLERILDTFSDSDSHRILYENAISLYLMR
jgi:predicted TIM-barrel fold metal-dependent hydrolase